MSDARIEVDVSGTLADLRRLGSAVEGDAIGRALMAGGFVVEGAGKEGIIRYDFVDTGATLNSVTVSQTQADEVRIGPTTEYAIFGELGIGQSEKPFMREALEQNRQAIADAIADGLRQALEDAIK